jgi:predicted HTH domain antitoxin
MTLINIDLSDDDIDEIEAVAELLGTDDEAVIRKALCEGLAEMRLDHAIERYQAGEVTVNQAARIADLSLADWLVVAREHGLTTQLTPADLDVDADAAEQL